MTEKKTVIVKFKLSTVKPTGNVVRSQDIDSITTLGGEIKQVLDSINAVNVEIDADKLKELKKRGDIEWVEESTPEDAHIQGFESEKKITPSQLKLLQSSQVVPWGISKIRAPEVYSNGNKGTGIKVCIIDTGVDYNHPDLKDNYKGGWDFITNTPDANDGYGHGTHVAGTVAAGDNDIGVIGVAPEAFIYSYRVLDSNGSGSYSDIVAAIQRAINEKMQIVSMSLGGSGYSQALKDICDAAKKAGIVVIAAAGNADGDGSQDTVGYPAKFASVIAVASTDVNDNRSSFSSCGSEVEVAAPGSNILSTVPTSGTTISDPIGYKNLNGTSMATPHVSGAVALMLKANPSLTPDSVRDILGKTSDDLGAPGKDVFFGRGRIDAKAAVDVNPEPTKKYRCTGSPDFQCVEDPNGNFNSIEECQAACKETPPPPVLTTITISPASATVNVGKTVGLKAVCKDQNGNVMTCPKLVWSSDNNIVATVDGIGNVTGVTVGTANITAIFEDVISNPSAITVVAIPVPHAKFTVIPTGVGAVVFRNMFGNMTADEAIAKVTDIIRGLDK